MHACHHSLCWGWHTSHRMHSTDFDVQINEGTVLAVGGGRRSLNGDIIPVSVKAGDKVLLPEYGGTPVKLDDKE